MSGDATTEVEGDSAPLLTVGHGTASQEQFAQLLIRAEVVSVVDVRRFPGSRRHPHVAREELARWLPHVGIDYRWDERLGGRRRGQPDSPHVRMRNASFRAYADHLGTPTFRTAVDELLTETVDRRVAVMCSESLWWRCHRRLIADHVALLAHRRVLHLMHDGRLQPHEPTDVVRVEDGWLVYDAGAPTLDLDADHRGAGTDTR